MKKVLSTLLAVIVIFGITAIPLSAENSLSLQVPIDGQSETSPIQPAWLGDQTTYHICFASDARMVTASGSSVYSNLYIQNNTGMQWIFEEYFSVGTYIIRSVENPSYVLSLSSSGSICAAEFGSSNYT